MRDNVKVAFLSAYFKQQNLSLHCHFSKENTVPLMYLKFKDERTEKDFEAWKFQNSLIYAILS